MVADKSGVSPCLTGRAAWLESRFALVSLWDIMKLFEAHHLFRSGHILTDGAQYAYISMKAEDRQRPILVSQREFFESIGAQVTVKKIDDMLNLLPTVDANTLNQQFQQLRDIIGLELSTVLFLHLQGKEATFYQYPRRGWEEVISRFPDTISDIEEANKCFALSRYAAAVFHSLQLVEVGLIALCRFLRSPDPQLGWNAAEKSLSAAIKQKYDMLSDEEKQYRPFLEQVNGTVQALKDAWRNKISHAQGKLTLLTADFTPEVAEEILMAARAFMRRLATEMPT